MDDPTGAGGNTGAVKSTGSSLPDSSSLHQRGTHSCWNCCGIDWLEAPFGAGHCFLSLALSISLNFMATSSGLQMAKPDPTREERWKSFLHSIESNSLTEVNETSIWRREHGMHEFAAALRGNQSVRELRLSGQVAGLAAVRSLAASLKETLELYFSTIGLQGASALAAGLVL